MSLDSQGDRGTYGDTGQSYGDRQTDDTSPEVGDRGGGYQDSGYEDRRKAREKDPFYGTDLQGRKDLIEQENRRTPEEITQLIPDVIDNIRINRLNELRIRRINQIRETIRQRRIELSNMYTNYYRSSYQDIIPEYDDDGFNNRDLDEAIRQSLQ